MGTNQELCWWGAHADTPRRPTQPFWLRSCGLSAFPEMGRRRAAAGCADKRFFIRALNDRPRVIALAAFMLQERRFMQLVLKRCGQCRETRGKPQRPERAVVYGQVGRIGNRQRRVHIVVGNRERRPQDQEDKEADRIGRAAGPLGQLAERKQHQDDAPKRPIAILSRHLHTLGFLARIVRQVFGRWTDFVAGICRNAAAARGGQERRWTVSARIFFIGAARSDKATE